MFPVQFESTQGAFSFDAKGDRDASLSVGNFNYELAAGLPDGYSSGLPWETVASYSAGAGYVKEVSTERWNKEAQARLV